MQETTIMAEGLRRRSVRWDALAAFAIGTLLSVGWAITGWVELYALILPDADDMVRLAQIRDWVAGQATNDWTQYRMAAPYGAAMHWSRLADMGPAAIILAVTPLFGRHAAELTAVLLYPAILFVTYMFLSARIARRLWSPAAGFPAVVIAGLAYPGTIIFLPGRLDHHGLQTVLILGFLLAIMRSPSLGSGLAAGVAAALSLMVGLETAPHVALLIAALTGFWIVDGARERRRLGGFAAALAGVTLLFLATMRPTLWSPEFCDAFTPASSTGILLGSAALTLLALGSGGFSGWRARLGAAAVLGGGVVGATLYLFPACAYGPYGSVDPLLKREFLAHIQEAKSVFAQPTLVRIFGLTGMLAAACVVAVGTAVRRPLRWRLTVPIAAVVLVSALITLVQIRGVYIGVPAAAPVMAGLVLAARRRGTYRVPAVFGAWLASAGLCYSIIPGSIVRLVNESALEQVDDAGTKEVATCSASPTWREVNRLQPAVIMTPTTAAPFIIGATHMSTVAAGYHRNNQANVDMYRYFLGPIAEAPAIARRWNVTYVAFCPTDFHEIDVEKRYPHSLGALMASGRAPADFRPVPLRGTTLRLYRIRD